MVVLSNCDKEEELAVMIDELLAVILGSPKQSASAE